MKTFYRLRNNSIYKQDKDLNRRNKKNGGGHIRLVDAQYSTIDQIKVPFFKELACYIKWTVHLIYGYFNETVSTVFNDLVSKVSHWQYQQSYQRFCLLFALLIYRFHSCHLQLIFYFILASQLRQCYGRSWIIFSTSAEYELLEYRFRTKEFIPLNLLFDGLFLRNLRVINQFLCLHGINYWILPQLH